MNDKRKQDDFEERLLAHLRVVVRERGELPAFQAPATTSAGGFDARRLAPRLAIGGAGVAAVAAAVLVISSGTGDTSRAFAVEPRGEGDVRVQISSLSDAKGLETALDEAGINSNVEYLEAGMACREPRFKQPAPTAGKGIEVHVGLRQTPIGTTFTVNQDAVGPGQTLVISASPANEDGPIPVGLQVAEGTVGACVPVPASTQPQAPSGAETDTRHLPEKGLTQVGGGPEEHLNLRSAPE
jgi:hypothetical protein